MFKKFITFVSFLALAVSVGAQQPQNTLAPIVAENAKYANGVAPGYAPTSGTGLNVDISSGTVNCGGTIVTFTGAAEPLTANAVNYVYLNTTSSCAVSVKTTAFVAADIPIAIVTTGSSSVLATCNNSGTASPSGSYPCIIDDRTMFNAPLQAGVSGITAGAGISATPSTGNVTVSNTGVTSITNNASATGALQFSGSGVSQSGTTFTFSGTSSNSGQCFLGIGGLVGAFTDGSGVIKGSPLCIGNGPATFTVPSGATQLLLGIDDDKFSDNTGSFTIGVGVNGAAATNYTVLGTSMPWSVTTNASYSYGINDGTAAVVTATGLGTNTNVTISYVSGTVSVGSGFPNTDANGYLTTPPGSPSHGGPTANSTGSTGQVFPTYYMGNTYTSGAITSLTGDGTAAGPGSVPLTLATVNASPGTCGDSTHVCQVTVNGKGLTTSQTAVAISGGAAAGGTVTYTTSTTASTADTGKLVVMNCSAACSYTLPATQPSTAWFAGITSQGSTLATVVLGGGDTFNGSASVPVLNSFRILWVYANTATTTDYRGDAPLVAGTNMTLTPASNGLTLASSASGGGPTGVASPYAEYPMTDGSGTTVTDISGNGRNGTLSAAAPAWVAGGGLHFNGTLAAPTNEYVTTPITTWGSVVMNICPDPLAATSGTSTGGPFYAQFPTILAPSGTTANGLILLSSANLNNKYQGAFSPAIFANSGGTFNTVTDYGNSGCYNIGYSLGASDHIYVNGQEMAYTTQGASSASVTTTGTYAIGSNGTSTGNNANAFVGYINYAVFFSGVLTSAQQMQESQYINYKTSLRSTYPEVPQFTRTTRTQQVIFLGDSLTAGYQGNGVWTSFVAPSPVSGTYSYVNWGLASDEAATESSMVPFRAGTQISSQGKNYVFIWLGTNDCADGAYGPQEIWSNLQGVAAKVKALGGIPIAVTMISRSGQETCRGTGTPFSSPLGLNDYIRSYWRRSAFMGLLDLAEQPNLGALNAYTNATYYNGDGIHLTGGNACNTTTGYGLVCEGATAMLTYLDGYDQSHPYTGTDTTLAMGVNYRYVIENPSANATYTLPDCTYLTGAEFTISNRTSSFSFTIAPFSGQTISGATTIAAGTALTYVDTLTSASTGGCFWSVK